MAKSDKFYFENLTQAADFCYQAGKYLQECLTNFDHSNIETMLKNMHNLEHQADIKKHEMSDTLAKSFVTPVDREDLALISQNIDDVADSIEEVMQEIYINRIKTIMPEAIEFASNIVSSCDLMKQLLAELANFKRPKKLHDMIINLNHMEERCDELYLKATLKIPEYTNDVLEIVFWRNIYRVLEKCADACEHVGDCVDTVVMKNT